MSGRIVGLVTKIEAGSPTKKAILFAMAEKADEAGEYMWKSASTIAEEVECSRETVIRAWKAFEKADRPILQRMGTRKVQGGEAIVWRFNPEILAEADEKRRADRGKTGDVMSPVPQNTGDARSPLPKKPGDARSPVLEKAVTSDHGTGDVRSPNTPLTHKLRPAVAAEFGGATGNARDRFVEACREQHGLECHAIIAGADGWDDHAIYLSSPYLLSYAERLRKILRDCGVTLKPTTEASANVVSFQLAKQRG